MLKQRGYVYTAKHEGWYAVSDETFYPPSAVQLALDPSTGRKFMVGIGSTAFEYDSDSKVGFGRDRQRRRMDLRGELSLSTLCIQGSSTRLL